MHGDLANSAVLQNGTFEKCLPTPILREKIEGLVEEDECSWAEETRKREGRGGVWRLGETHVEDGSHDTLAAKGNEGLGVLFGSRLCRGSARWNLIEESGVAQLSTFQRIVANF